VSRSAKIVVAVSAIVALIVVIFVLAASALESSDMFGDHRWNFQSPGIVRGRSCVRAYPGEGHGEQWLMICAEKTGQPSCWEPAEADAGNASRVLAWTRVEAGDEGCKSAVSAERSEDLIGLEPTP
jgi:hypothetical protein